MSPQQKEWRQEIFQADDENHYAVVELLWRFYINQFPDDGDVWLRRGEALSAFCRYEEADSAFDMAMTAIDAEYIDLFWLAKADSFKRRGNYIDAESCYLQALEYLPQECWLLILLAHVTWRRGDLALAEKRFREATAVEGEERDEAFFNLGGVMLALGNFEEAAQCYREALSLSPDYEIAQRRLEDVEQALKLQFE